MDGIDSANPAPSSAIGRLLEEMSWEGKKVRQYRGGGVGLENVLTTEVFMALDFLPRVAFLGSVVRGAHGADTAREVLGASVEVARIDVLPGDLFATRPGDATRPPVQVQPDALVVTGTSWAFVEAKRVRSSSFQPEQLAREFVVTLEQAGDRVPLLLLVLGSRPPVTVKDRGPLSITDAITGQLSAVTGYATGDPELEELIDRIPDVVAWTTWTEIRVAVLAALGHHDTGDPSTQATVTRLARSLVDAVDRHS